MAEGRIPAKGAWQFAVSGGALTDLLLCALVWGAVQWVYVKQAALHFWKAWTVPPIMTVLASETFLARRALNDT